eukprot:scaffold668233_cov62-Prasinocladus_malaysianus.AAC.1
MDTFFDLAWLHESKAHVYGGTYNLPRPIERGSMHFDLMKTCPLLPNFVNYLAWNSSKYCM